MKIDECQVQTAARMNPIYVKNIPRAFFFTSNFKIGKTKLHVLGEADTCCKMTQTRTATITKNLRPLGEEVWDWDREGINGDS